jgi:hypothetical protein
MSIRKTFIGTAIAVVLLAGCATPESRIKDHPEIFNQASPEEQALIRKGEIALGFTPDFVKLAIGNPDRVSERTDAAGKETIWHYTELETAPGYTAFGYDPAFVSPLMVVSGPYGPIMYAPPYVPFYPPPSPEVERDKVRVNFRDGKVVAIERVLGRGKGY